jgi:hypothetical protein
VERVKARPDQPEGDVYEVEYILGESKAAQGKLNSTESTQHTLYRRLWPNPDRKKEPGGILCPIAENIDVFQTRFYDGKQWVDQWTEEMRDLPQLIEVTLAVIPQGRGEPTIQSFVVTFPRMSRGGVSSSSGQGSPDQSSGSQPDQGSSQGSSQPGSSGQPGQSGPTPSPGGR